MVSKFDPLFPAHGAVHSGAQILLEPARRSTQANPDTVKNHYGQAVDFLLQKLVPSTSSKPERPKEENRGKRKSLFPSQSERSESKSCRGSKLQVGLNKIDFRFSVQDRNFPDCREERRVPLIPESRRAGPIC